MAKKQTDHEKIRAVWFCTVSHKADCIEHLKKEINMFPIWGWIDHKPENSDDEEDKHFHTHFIFMTKGTRSIKQVSDSLGIPSNFIQKCKNPTSYRRYFIHKDNPEKIQYSLDDIHTNKLSDFKSALTDTINDDIISLYHDMAQLRCGKIVLSEFINKHYIELQKMSMYQKIKIFEYLDKIGCVLT